MRIILSKNNNSPLWLPIYSKREEDSIVSSVKLAYQCSLTPLGITHSRLSFFPAKPQTLKCIVSLWLNVWFKLVVTPFLCRYSFPSAISFLEIDLFPYETLEFSLSVLQFRSPGRNPCNQENRLDISQYQVTNKVYLNYLDSPCLEYIMSL